MCNMRKLGARDLAGLHARRAHVHLANLTVIQNGDFLDVGTERTLADAMGVADATTGHRVLTANFTNLGHVSHSITSDNL